MVEVIKMLLSRWEKTAEIIDGPGGAFVAAREGVRLQPAPVGRPTVPPRSHTFADVPSFAGWLKRYALPETEILADFGEGFVAYPDHTWSGDLLRCQPKAHPAWVTLECLSGKSLRQPEFYQQLLKLQPYLENADVLAAVAVLEVKTNGKIVSNVDPRTGATKLVSVEKEASYPINLPAEITFKLPLHIGAEAVQVQASLLPAVSDAGLTLTLTIKERELVLLAAWEKQVEQLRELLGKDWLVGLGKLQIAQ